jgi:CheY-like chemotaxis protein
MVTPADEPRRVLIVDPSDDTRQVLRTVLERRGWQIAEACEAQQGRSLADQLQPHVIVLDLEILPPTGPEGDRPKAPTPDWNQTPMVLLGSLAGAALCAEQRHVAKPYHYAALIRTIEELLKVANCLPAALAGGGLSTEPPKSCGV